ncbi:MAG: AmmeMemoRadiSam system protein B [Thermodesulfovibrio sp.]|nr:AmmeMemoRadiSam system protein B [Thermodesulfovibrio sp.]MCX7724220.1 AmmeMemoRadiSam system protein B [Thermodesulfovibrio sp.]MDW7972615.1 AmmeMemoRadiSam system protein B [Thermodesulfovibrio sp.]
MNKRRAVVAGYFYPSNPKELLQELEEYMPPNTKIEAIGAVCPHAGYVYSGSVAGSVYSKLKSKEIFIIIGPNHTGYGPNVSVMAEGEWEIPLGSMKINSEVARKIIEKSPYAEDDIKAHLHEHSLEVQLPFIYKLNPKAEIVPITLKMLSVRDCLSLAQSIATSVEELNIKDKIILIASTDLSHYLPDDMARKVDSLVVEKIKNFDPEGLYNTVIKHNISMCGFIPTTVMLYTTKLLGAKEVQIIKYATSAEVSRDYDKVVGYLGAIVI